MQAPNGGQIAAILVRVGIPDHDFLKAERRRHGCDFRQLEPSRHHGGRLREIADGFEQRDGHDIGPPAAPCAIQAGLLEQDIDLEQIRHALAFGHDVSGDAGAAVAPVRFGRRAHDVELRQGFRRVARVRPRQQPLAGEFMAQQQHTVTLAERLVICRHARDLEQFGDHPRVHVRVLPQVQGRQMEAEGLHRPAQSSQGARGVQSHLILRPQGLFEYLEVGTQTFGIRIRLRAHRRRPRRHASRKLLKGGGKARVDSRVGAPVGFVGPGGIEVAAALRQLSQLGGHGREFARQRQFGPQRIELFEIVGQQRLRRAAERQTQRIRGDMRISIAVAADPAAETQETRRPRAQQAFPPSVERRDRGQKNIAQIGQRGVDLVRDVQPLAPQCPRLPQQGDLRGDPFLDQLPISGFGAPQVALSHQGGDAIAVIQHALAHDLGGMRRQHRDDQRSVEQRRGFAYGDALCTQELQCGGERAALFRSGALPVFGQIGQHGKQHEAAYEGNSLVERQRVQARRQAARVGEAAMAVDGGGADRFDALKQNLAAVAADDVSQQLAEEADISVLSDGRELGHDGAHISPAAASALSYTVRGSSLMKPGSRALYSGGTYKYLHANHGGRTLSTELTMRIKAWNLSILPTLILLLSPALSTAQVNISVNIAPPELPVYDQPPIPGDGYVWTPGYWAWGDDIQDYYWVPGTWVPAPEPEYLWTPGYWGSNGVAFIWYPGYWGPHVGFYGGVNYGYGYGGQGYEGGYWQGGRMYYNRSVNNISNTNITNVYNKTVINNVSVTRVSYNGGSGGVRAEPTSTELAAAHERHIAATPVQSQHIQAARRPQPRRSANCGDTASRRLLRGRRGASDARRRSARCSGECRQRGPRHDERGACQSRAA